MIKKIYYDGIDSYSIKYDEKELIKFRKKVIKNASIVEHYDYISTNGSYDFTDDINSLEVQNFTKEEVEDGIFHYKYDVYNFPYLAYIIEDIINGNTNSLDLIINPNWNNEYVPVYARIEELTDKINESDDIDKKIAYANEIKNLLISVRDDNVFIPVSEYYCELQQLIHLKKININKTMKK